MGKSSAAMSQSAPRLHSQYLVNLLCRCPLGSVWNLMRHKNICSCACSVLILKLLEVTPLFKLTRDFALVISLCYLELLLSQKPVLFGLHCLLGILFLFRFLIDETSKPELLVTPKLARPGEVGSGFWHRS